MALNQSKVERTMALNQSKVVRTMALSRPFMEDSSLALSRLVEVDRAMTIQWP